MVLKHKIKFKIVETFLSFSYYYDKELSMKKISLALFFCLALMFGFAEAPAKTTEKTAVEGRKDAYIYVTKIYDSEYWAEFYVAYEEPSKTFDEAQTEKILYEFISNYKVEHKYSRVEVEDLEAARQSDNVTRVTKRVIFRQLHK